MSNKLTEAQAAEEKARNQFFGDAMFTAAATVAVLVAGFACYSVLSSDSEAAASGTVNVWDAIRVWGGGLLAFFGTIYIVTMMLPGCWESLSAWRNRKKSAEKAKDAQVKQDSEAKRQRDVAEAESRRRDAAKKEAARTQHISAARNLPKDLADREQAVVARLEEATKWLNQAATDYQANRFSPFWDAMRKATEQLAVYQDVTDNLARRVSLIPSIVGAGHRAGLEEMPALPAIDVEGHRGSGTAAAGLLKELWNTAQSNFQFASIYEQRRTTEAVIAGLGSMQDAIGVLGDRIVGSVASLSAQWESVERTSHAHDSELVQALRTVSIDNFRYGSTQHQMHQITSQLDTISRSLR